ALCALAVTVDQDLELTPPDGSLIAVAASRLGQPAFVARLTSGRSLDTCLQLPDHALCRLAKQFLRIDVDQRAEVEALLSVDLQRPPGAAVGDVEQQRLEAPPPFPELRLRPKPPPS